MHSTHITSPIKLFTIVCIFVMLGSLTACKTPVESPPPPAEFFDEGVMIDLFAERTNLQPGECTMLFWNTEGGIETFLNGEPVERSGEREICLGNEPMGFVLDLDTGERVESRSIEIRAEGIPGEEHPPEPNSEEPPQPEPQQPQPEPQQPQPQQPQPQPQPQQPAPQVQAPTQAPAAPANKCQSNFETDIAVTDLYAGNLPNGQVHVRITNHGPCTLQNVKDSVYCFIDLTNHSNGKTTFDSKTVNVVYNMAPGTQQTFPTGITLDTNVFKYKVTCNLQPGNFKELNPNNNSHSEQIP
jgi:hypothetical protein